MPEKYLAAFLLGVFFILAPFQAGFACSKASDQQDNGGARGFQTAAITWENSYQKDGSTVIPGSVMTDSGRVTLRWILLPNRTTRLVSVVTPGAGERPPVETPLYLLLRQDGTTAVFQEWFPLVNTFAPPELRAIAVVKTEELFAVTGVNSPPVHQMGARTAKITWDGTVTKNEVQYVGGAVQTEFGQINIYWKVDGMPQLITLDAPGAGEMPPQEAKLYLWHDKTNAVTMILQVRAPLLNQGGPSYLWPLVTVSTDDLMDGLKKANR